MKATVHYERTPRLSRRRMIGLALASMLAPAMRLAHAAQPQGPELPSDLMLEDLDGRAVTPRRYRGQPTVVNLWATWCGPCRREMPVLAGAQRARPDVNFVFVNEGEAAALVERYLRQAQLTLRNVLLDRRQVLKPFAGGALPTTLFIDENGHVMARHQGALTATTLGEYLDALPGSRSPRPGSVIQAQGEPVEVLQRSRTLAA